MAWCPDGYIRAKSVLLSSANFSVHWLSNPLPSQWRAPEAWLYTGNVLQFMPGLMPRTLQLCSSTMTRNTPSQINPSSLPLFYKNGTQSALQRPLGSHWTTWGLPTEKDNAGCSARNGPTVYTQLSSLRPQTFSNFNMATQMGNRALPDVQ